MFHHTSLENLTRRWKIILLVGIIVGALSGLITLLFPLQYRADAQVLIISKSRYGVDPYTVVKSAERIGENIIQVMKTSDFYFKVKEQPGYGIDWSSFDNKSERERRKLWNRTIGASVVYGTGVLNINAYHQDADQARQLAAAAATTLAAKGWEYVGGDVAIKVVNEPVTTKWPVRPNIFVNVVLGFFASVILAGVVFARK